MTLAIILGILFGSALTVFALENASTITLSMLSVQFSAPIAFVVVAAAGFSIVATLLALLPSMLRNEKQIKLLQAQKKQAEDELAKYTIVIPVAPPAQHASRMVIEEREKVHAA